MNNENPGHWYCSTCNSVVFLNRPWGRWDATRNVTCRECGKDTCNWIKPDSKPFLTQERAQELFSEMKGAAK